MREELIIPQGVSVKIENDEVTVSKNGKSIKKLLDHPGVKISVDASKIFFDAQMESRHAKKLVNTYKAHVKNLFKGLEEDYVYKLKVCFSHFPMEVVVKGEEVLIKNFLGEKKPRIAKIVGKSVVKVEGDFVTVTNSNKEFAGQTAANIELASNVKKHDRRRFQDGIYLTMKAGVEI